MNWQKIWKAAYILMFMLCLGLPLFIWTEAQMERSMNLMSESLFNLDAYMHAFLTAPPGWPPSDASAQAEAGGMQCDARTDGAIQHGLYR